MGKRVRATYIAVLDALKAHNCISGYSIIGNEVKPEWKDEGIARVVQEVNTNPRPFGLNGSQRGGLLMVLPQKDREKADAVLLDGFKKKYGLGLVLMFLFLTLVVATAQQTNSPLRLHDGSSFDETLAKATSGDVNAEESLAFYYLTAKNFTDALKWFGMAAASGDESAQNMLGTFYQHGTAGAVEKDNNKAAYWYLRAAKQGDDQSQLEIGWMYYGGDGVVKDYVEAYKWFNIASTSTTKPPTKEQIGKIDNDSLKALLTSTAEKGKDARDAIAPLMTPEQIAEAQRRSAEFAPKKESGSDNSTSPENPTASGSGFFITDDGYLISNYHVVKAATKVRLVTSAGTIDAKVVQVDAANDLALLKADGKFSPLPIAVSRSAHLGGTVATIGFPDPSLQGFSPKLAKGEIASLSGAGDDPRYFQISVPVQPGNSGGALVDERGNVIGIVSAKLDASVALAASGALPENVNYAVKSSLLLSFLESVPDVANKLKEPNTKAESFEEVVKSAQNAAVLVLVY